MIKLLDNVTSDWIDAANRLLPGRKGGRIIAYVESYEDVAFWRLLLDEFETEDRYFQIMLPSKFDLTKGKKSALKACLNKSAYGNHLIACVDSDYDYLLQGSTFTSKEMLSNPFIIQTYAYAIENYQSFSSSLHQICVQCTLNDRRIVDFELFMEYYSKIVFPLFVWNIWFYRNKLHNKFSMQELSNEIKIRSIDVNHPEYALEYLADRVRRKIRWLEKYYSSAIDDVEQLKGELRSLGVEDDNTYLFLQGHNLIDNVIMKLLVPVCMSLRSERENEIRRLAVHSEQYQNELSAYQHSQMSIEEAIRKNTHYRDCKLYKKMKDAVMNLIKKIS